MDSEGFRTILKQARDEAVLANASVFDRLQNLIGSSSPNEQLYTVIKWVEEIEKRVSPVKHNGQKQATIAVLSDGVPNAKPSAILTAAGEFVSPKKRGRPRKNVSNLSV